MGAVFMTLSSHSFSAVLFISASLCLFPSHFLLIAVPVTAPPRSLANKLALDVGGITQSTSRIQSSYRYPGNARWNGTNLRPILGSLGPGASTEAVRIVK